MFESIVFFRGHKDLEGDICLSCAWVSDLNQMSTAGSRRGHADSPAGKPWQLGPVSREAAATQFAKPMCEVGGCCAGRSSLDHIFLLCCC